MLEQRFGRWLPGWLRRRYMVVEALIEASVERLAGQLPNGARVLDAGAGEGRHAAYFPNCRYTGIDSTVGDDEWDYSGLSVRGDLERLPFPAGSFDAALNIVVLEHCARPGLVLAEIARVLKPQGRLLIIAPLSWEVHQAPNDFFRYTCHGLERLLTDAGFREPRIVPIGGFFVLFARRLLNALNFVQGGLRWVLFPFVAVSAGVGALVLPWFDFLDREKNFTLGYLCLAEK